jgi:capreomycidine synthase
MRRYFFETQIDLGSSGVESFSFGQLRELIGLSQDDLDEIIFDDSRTLGGPGLRSAIAKRWAGGKIERIMATHGSSEAIFLIMNAILGSDDEVISIEPCYQQLYAVAESIGCRLKGWRLRFEDQFAPVLEELRRLMTNKTRMVVVNFPHNPTGVALCAEQQKELIGIVAEHGAYLVWDAAFAELTYDNLPIPGCDADYEKLVVLGTLSKAYGLPGLRVGWFTGPRAMIDRAVHIRDYLTLHLSPLVELIAQRAIENADALIGIRFKQVCANLEFVSDWVEQQKGKVDWVRPAGGVCSFPRFNSISNLEQFCHRLAQEYKVLLVPGACFNHPAHVRLGFGGPTKALVEGLSILSTLL